MSEITVGDQNPNYKTVDQKAQEAARPDRLGVVQQPSRRWRLAKGLGIAGLLATLGLAGAEATGHSPKQVVGDAAGAVTDVATRQGSAEKNTWQYGSPLGPRQEQQVQDQRPNFSNIVPPKKP